MAIKNEERRLLKNRYIKGAIRTVSGTDTVKIEDSSGIGFEKIIIKGKTTHKERTFSEILMGILKSGEYTSAGVSGAVAYKLPEGWAESQLSFAPVITGEAPAFSVSLADGQSFLFSSSVELLSTQGGVNPFSGSGYGYIIVSGITSDEDLNTLWENVAIEVSSLGTYLGKREYEITNAGDGSVEIKLTSKNLLNPKGFKSYTYSSVKMQIDGSYIVLNGIATRDTYISPLDTNPDSRVLLTDEMKCSTLTFCAYYEDGSILPLVEIGLYDSTNTISPLWTNCRNYCASMLREERDKIWLRIRMAKGVTLDERIRIMVMDGKYNKVQDFVPYYEPTSILLPLQARDIEGNLVQLRLAGYGDKCDYLEVDKQGGRVLYYCYVLEQDSTKSAEEQELLDEPVVYDLTDCDFAKELLSLSVPYKNGGTLRAEGASGIEVKYFATKGEDQVQMKIRYMCDGSEIADDFSHKVRKGSFYHISHPYISGYRARGEDFKGYANKDTEIILEYTKG